MLGVVLFWVPVSTCWASGFNDGTRNKLLEFQLAPTQLADSLPSAPRCPSRRLAMADSNVQNSCHGQSGSSPPSGGRTMSFLRCAGAVRVELGCLW